MEAGEATPVSLSFTLTCVRAEQVAYRLILDADPVPTAAELLASGTQASVGDPVTIALYDLTEQTDYIVAAAARYGDLLSEVQTLRMSTPAFDAVVEGTRAIGGYYGGDLSGSRNGQYSLNISNVHWEGTTARSAGYTFMLSLYSDMSADPDHAAPAAGTYKVDVTTSQEKFTIDNTYTKWVRTDETGAAVSAGTLTAGTITIEITEEGAYRVSGYLTTDVGEMCKVSWEGPIEWLNNTTPPVADQVLEARHALVSYFGADATHHPDTDWWHIELYDDLDDARQGLFIECFAPVASNPQAPMLPEGTFAVGTANGYDAWTYTPGDQLLTLRTGSYLIAKVNNYERDYFCTGGTFTVSLDSDPMEGDVYTITCDFTTSAGTRITGGFTGKDLQINNEYMPVVDEDLTVTCDRIYQDRMYYSSFAGLHNYNVFLCDAAFTEPDVPDAGGPANILSIDLYTDVAPEDGTLMIPDGTYSLGGMQAGKFTRPFTYGIHYDEKGRQCQKITFTEGTLTISRADGIYTLLLDCTTSLGHRYVGHYVGELSFGGTQTAGIEMRREIPDLRPEHRLRMPEAVGSMGARGTGTVSASSEAVFFPTSF